MLGKGAYGKAYLVECTTDNSTCVIKQIDMNEMSASEQRECVKEARILESLQHPNIISFREVFSTKGGKLCIVMEYADGGDLAGTLKSCRQKKTRVREDRVLDWFC